MDGYGEDLAAIHAAGFTEMAQDAARELLGRLPPGARVLELGCATAALRRRIACGCTGRPTSWPAYDAPGSAPGPFAAAKPAPGSRPG